jgi:hypothetical protein
MCECVNIAMCLSHFSYIFRCVIRVTPFSGRASRISFKHTPNHVGERWLIYCYVDILMHLVAVYEDVSTKMHGKENIKNEINTD